MLCSVGYVEFREEDSVQKAIQLTGQKLLGTPIIAQLTDEERRLREYHDENTVTHADVIPFHHLHI